MKVVTFSVKTFSRPSVMQHVFSLPQAQVDSAQVRLIGHGQDESEDLLTSQWGELSVTRQGAARGPVLVTLHDIGLDYKSNFQV